MSSLNGALSDESPKGVLVYYLPISFDCESPDVMTYTVEGIAKPLRYKNAKFTRKMTTTTPQFTVCIVGIR